MASFVSSITWRAMLMLSKLLARATGKAPRVSVMTAMVPRTISRRGRIGFRTCRGRSTPKSSGGRRRTLAAVAVQGGVLRRLLLSECHRRRQHCAHVLLVEPFQERLEH